MRAHGGGQNVTAVAVTRKTSSSRSRTSSPFALGRSVDRSAVDPLGMRTVVASFAIGITGSSVFQTDVEATLRPGETVDVAGYRLQFEELDVFAVSGVDVVSASIVAFDGDSPQFRLVPQRHFHPRNDNPTTEVAIWSGVRHDLYVVLAGWDNEGGGMATFKMYLNPLVAWIWIGGFVMMFGTLICLIPDRSLSDSGTANY